MMSTQETRDALIEQHTDYVAALARNIAKQLPAHVDLDDLIGYGKLGLVEAAERYTFGLGASFATFAYNRIRGAIFDGIRKMTWLPPAARRWAKANAGVDEVAEQIGEAAGQSSDPEQLAAQLQEAFRSVGAVFLLSESEDEDGQRNDPADGSDPARDVEQQELLDRLRSTVERLPDKKHAAIIRMHYFEGKNLTECAAALGVHKAWVSRLHVAALKELQRLLLGAAAAP